MFKKIMIIMMINSFPFFVLLISHLSVNCDSSINKPFNPEEWQDSRVGIRDECEVKNHDVNFNGDNS